MFEKLRNAHIWGVTNESIHINAIAYDNLNQNPISNISHFTIKFIFGEIFGGIHKRMSHLAIFLRRYFELYSDIYLIIICIARSYKLKWKMNTKVSIFCEISFNFCYRDMKSALKLFWCHGIAFHLFPLMWILHTIVQCHCILSIFSTLFLYICLTRVKCHLTQTSKAMRQKQMKDERKIPLPCTTDLIRKLSNSSFQIWLSHFKRKYFPFIYDCLSCMYRPLHTQQFLLHRIFSYFRVNCNLTIDM